MFQLTAPLREPTLSPLIHLRCFYVSTHGSLAGADLVQKLQQAMHYRFNSRLPCGSRLSMHVSVYSRTFVSTHSSLAGADFVAFMRNDIADPVSTHGSLAGADMMRLTTMDAIMFQLTAPLREPTKDSA